MNRFTPSLLALATALLLSTPAVVNATSPSTVAVQPAQDKASQLNALYEQYWEESLKLNPLRATFQGDPRYNDQLPNFLSAEFREQSLRFTRDWLQKIEAVGAEGLSGQDLLSYQIFVRDARNEIEGSHFPDWMQPINQFYNIASTVVQLGSGTGAQPFKTVQDYDNWQRRASRFPVLFDQAIANMREGIEAGVVQPRALMEKVVPQLDALIKPKAEDTLFWGPITKLPESFSAADKQRITNDYRQLIEGELLPAYRELRQFIVDDYLPHTRTSAGMAALPNGEAWYAYKARDSTSTDLSPAQIHQIGLDEVARIHGLMRGVMKELGY